MEKGRARYIEPYSSANSSYMVEIRNTRISHAGNYGIAAENWVVITNLRINGLYVIGCGLGSLSGGALMGQMTDITAWWGLWRVMGQNMAVSDSAFGKLRLSTNVWGSVSDLSYASSGAHLVTNVRVLNPDEGYLDSGNLGIADGVYLVSGPIRGNAELVPRIVPWGNVGHRAMLIPP